MFGQPHPCQSFLDFRLTPFVLSKGKLDRICWREIYNSFVFPCSPWSKCFFRDIKSVRGSHCNGKKSIFTVVELKLKLKQTRSPSNMIKQTIDSYATTNTIFSHTLCFPAQMEQTAVIGYAGKKLSQTFRSCRFVTNIQNIVN